MQANFALDDFRKQMAIVIQPGVIQKLTGIMPGLGPLHHDVNEFDTAGMKSLFGIIDAMTPAERSNSELIDTSRRHRIARGAGCEPDDVDALVKQFHAMARVMISKADKGSRNRTNIMGEGERKN